LRQELYYCDQYGIESHLKRIGATSYQQAFNRIDGTVRYVASIETHNADALRGTWRSIVASDTMAVSYAPRHDAASRKAMLLFDEAELEVDGTRMLVVGCVSTEQVEQLRTITTAVLDKYLSNPFTPGRKGKLEKKGLHFTDAPEALRAEYIAALAPLPFRMYMAFGALRDDDAYPLVYVSLLKKLIPHRLIANDRARLKMVFEENPRVKASEIQRVIEESYAELEARNDRRPLVPPEIEIGTKLGEPALGVPDTLLALFYGYFSGGGETAHLRFEQMRDKFRYIVNANTGEVFSRRHPLDVPKKPDTPQ
jgi:hypothetical protein